MASFNNPPLVQQINELFNDFEFDGVTLTQNHLAIAKERQLDVIYERYKNKIPDFQAADQNVEELLPFVQKFNGKGFWRIIDNPKIKPKDGQLLVEQDGQAILIKAGDYLNGGFFRDEDDKAGGPLDPITKITTRFVYIYRTKKIDRVVKNLYVNVEGKYALKIVKKPTIRFYFNLKPNAKEVILWAKSLQYELNKCRIPFQLKYPLNLQNYEFSDSGVLYVAQNHFLLVAPIIKIIAQKFNDLFFDSLPLFTFKLFTGIGFAEDPFEDRESFGRHRCNLIWEYIEKNKLKLDTNNSVNTIASTVCHLNGMGYTDDFFIAANTGYSYDFNVFLHSLTDEKMQRNPSEKSLNILNYIQNKFEGCGENENNVVKKYEKYGRVRFLFLAENYAKDLIEKAIWNPMDKHYDWLTYDEEIINESKNGFYRLVTDEEKSLIHYFFKKLIANKYINYQYYSNVLNKLGFPDFLQSEEADIGSQLFDGLFDSGVVKNDLIKTINNIQKKADSLDTLTQLQANSRELADEVVTFFEKLSLPMKNDYGNFEYCPTFKGKLRIALLFIFASDPRSYSELNSEYKKWATKKVKNNDSMNEGLKPLSRFLSLPAVANIQ